MSELFFFGENGFLSSQNIWKLLDGLNTIIDIKEGVIRQGRRRRAGLGKLFVRSRYARTIAQLTDSFAINILFSALVIHTYLKYRTYICKQSSFYLNKASKSHIGDINFVAKLKSMY